MSCLWHLVQGDAQEISSGQSICAGLSQPLPSQNPPLVVRCQRRCCCLQQISRSWDVVWEEMFPRSAKLIPRSFLQQAAFLEWFASAERFGPCSEHPGQKHESLERALPHIFAASWERPDVGGVFVYSALGFVFEMPEAFVPQRLWTENICVSLSRVRVCWATPCSPTEFSKRGKSLQLRSKSLCPS